MGWGKGNVSSRRLKLLILLDLDLLSALPILISLRCATVRLAPLLQAWNAVEMDLFDLHNFMCCRAKAWNTAARSFKIKCNHCSREKKNLCK